MARPSSVLGVSRRGVSACFVSARASPRLCRRRHATGRPSGRPVRCAARDVKFPPYQIQTLPNGLQVVVVLHHEQPAVSMRLLIRAGSASDPKGKLGLVHELASLLDQGTETKSAGELADAIDFIGGAMGAGAATDLTYLNMVVMKDSFDAGHAHAVRHGAPSGVRAGGDRSPAAADALGPAGQPGGSRLRRRRRVRSARLRLPSLRHAAHRHARDASTPSPATTSSRSTRSISRPTTPSSPSSAT